MLYQRLYRLIRNQPYLNYFLHKLLYWLENNVVVDYLYQKFIFFKALKRPGTPPQLVFMVTNLCNSDCIMCPHKAFRDRNPHSTKVLSFELYQKVILEAANSVEQIVFTGGEPLLDPHLFERIEYARQHCPNAKLLLFTNGTLLDKHENIKKILASSLDSITISLDGTSEADFEKVRKNLSYVRLLANIRNLYSQKQNRRSSLLIRLSVLALKANEKSHQDFFLSMKGFADILEINNPHNFAGLVQVETKPAYKSKKRYPCYYLWSRLTIPPSGMISICGYDFDQGHPAGDIASQSLTEIWNGEPLEQARRLHLNKCFSDITMCRDCTAHVVWWKSFMV